MTQDHKQSYHEVDFLLPTQRFNIQFSYVSQKGLPFVREYVLRLVNIAPMSREQITIFFGFSKRESEEAIEDLVERGELTLSDNGRLTLTKKSSDYFIEVGESPMLSVVQDSGAALSFDLATFSCLGNEISNDKWKYGLLLRTDDAQASKSESLVERHFQRQFHEIYERGYLPKALGESGREAPILYTINVVNKLRRLPFRLPTEFVIDADGLAVEREDYEELKNSESVHEVIAVELSRRSKRGNIMDIAKIMMVLGDDQTQALFNANSISPQYLNNLKQLEENQGSGRSTFLGPIYSQENWALLQKQLASVLLARINQKSEVGSSRFYWLAPSDPFWGKSQRFIVSVSDFLNKSSTKQKRLYDPAIYLPVSDSGDFRAAKQWKYELEPHHQNIFGLLEGFLDGNVEILYLEDELVVVIYHLRIPQSLPVSMPLGFISKNSKMVRKIGSLVKEYVHGNSAFDKPNDCGILEKMAGGR